ncbi:hypothetical protein BDV18DRAFT_161741 [Aspergillus unguis]
MTDPLSVSASVAGLISICAGSTKLVFRFVTSIVDAPKEVRATIASLNGLNIALCQIQNLLLDLTYSTETEVDDLESLEQSVESCVGFFSVVDRDLQSVSHAAEEDFTAKKLWHQVKHVFEKESLQDALAGLEAQKETLSLVLTTLNSKSTANILRLVRNTQSIVHRNHQVLKKLELQVTRVFEDAIGRSYTSQSTVSLDSLCSPVEISQFLTHQGSTLSFALTDMDERSASLVMIPDMLSGVDCISTTLNFDDGAANQGVGSERRTIDSLYNLASVPEVESTSIQPTGAQSTPGHTAIFRLSRFVASMNKMGFSGPDAVTITLGLMNLVSKVLVATQPSATSRSHLEKLEKARARLEALDFTMNSKLPIRGERARKHVALCQKNVESATKAYVECVQKVYSGTTRRAALLQSLRTTADTVDGLWAAVERAMDDLDRTVNFALLDELKEDNEAAQAENRKTEGVLLEYLAKLEAGQARLEKRLALMDTEAMQKKTQTFTWNKLLKPHHKTRSNRT